MKGLFLIQGKKSTTTVQRFNTQLLHLFIQHHISFEYYCDDLLAYSNQTKTTTVQIHPGIHRELVVQETSLLLI